MKAKNIGGQAPGGKRTPLSEALPLDTPFAVQIFPIYACVFKCCYCIFSVEPSKRGFISDKIMMDLSLYKKCVDDMAKFPGKIKVIRFVGIGEPLLHKDIVEMVRYTAEKKIANVIEILTNASLLTPQMSDALLVAGLNRLVVSLQGTTAEKYQEISQANLDFEKFVGNLRYFYEHKGQAHAYFKIVDTALDNKEDEEKFYDIFGDICDSIAVEHTVPIHAGVNYEEMPGAKEMNLTQFGLPVSEVKICPQPFFHMQINPDGKVVPCYSWDYPGIMGDCNKESVTEIWNGPVFQKFRRTMLEGAKILGGPCADCNIVKYRLFPEDNLNSAAERLKQHYQS
ncbi:radical SAM protein [Patescibacteria group bacterium]|nr:MAG: radical SAM protein [Patescibacteria group bacterium]